MTTADLIVRLLRPEAPDKKFTQAEVDAINAIAASWELRSGVARSETSKPVPAWLVPAKGYVGQKEIVGPKHNPWIAKGWALLGWGGYNSDETPWCGYFVARCLYDVGLPYPKAFPSAASFSTYGFACKPQYGAIAVKKRKGGNHVFFIVGITPDGRYYKALGGNQSNMVNIVDIPVDQVDAIRWPSGQPESGYLPVKPRGALAASEA